MRTGYLIDAIVSAAIAAVTVGCAVGVPAGDVPEPAASVALYINEFMAANDSTIPDPGGNGGYSDWIEIYNASQTTVDMGGMYLTDDLADPRKWRVPDGVTVSPGGYLLFWADNDPEQGDTHASFKLAWAGEAVGLFHNDANGNAAIDTLTFEEQTVDVSFGRAVDGADAWQEFAEPTPGRPNG